MCERQQSFVKVKLEAAGATAELVETPGHPIIYAEKIVDPALPTVLVYGHYDVQPADPYELWDSPPFEPVIKNERIYARGACDDKGQMYMHIKAFESLMQDGFIIMQRQFMIEGEEEVGSSHLEDFVKNNKEKVKSGCHIDLDTSIISNDTPSIT